VAHSRGFTRGRTQSVRRSTEWNIGVEEVDGSRSATGSELWSGSAVPAAGGLTVGRIRGWCGLTLLSAAAAGDGFFGAIGIGIVTTAAHTAGSGSVPTPLTEEAWDGWMFHRYFDLRAITATIADGVNAFAAKVQIEIDTKAMRKLPLDMTLFGVTEVVESGTATMEIQADRLANVR